MGLTIRSTGAGALSEIHGISLNSKDDIVVALAGNPNTGKSTVFNSLTGLKQHTGNWTGKTVTLACGSCKCKGRNYVLVDLPGTYSLLSNSVEEEVARDFICFGNPHATVVVTDATCLERNLILVLQILEMTDRVVVCVNLMDEAERKKIRVDLDKLSELLGVPVVGTSARSDSGLDELMDAVGKIARDEITTNPVKIRYDDEIENAVRDIQENLGPVSDFRSNSRWVSLKCLDGDKSILKSINNHLGLSLSETVVGRKAGGGSVRDRIVSSIVKLAEDISQQVVHRESGSHNNLDRKIDNILTSRKFGIPAMIFLLGIVFWITIEGANIPSGIISNFLFGIEERLTSFFVANDLPDWLHGALVLGFYRTLAWVVSVMLPPMAIFFPLFTLLEDLGYLPRVAFNLDNFFKKACAHGKQALTMCMGFGCNAAGVIGCRIIDSPRERLIATITNNFVPCNGRFPLLITISSIFIAGAGAGADKSGAGAGRGVIADAATNASARISQVGTEAGVLRGLAGALAVTCVVVLGILMTFLVSKILSKTILKGIPSSFVLELPPYRKPQIGKILMRSVLDRTLFVLGRAASVAAPAGLVIWIMANTVVNGQSLLDYGAGFLQPFACLIGMDGYILMAFILGIPANEIVMPIILMSYSSSAALTGIENLETLGGLLAANGWTWLTAINVMLFSLMHFPCTTTLLTIKKETKSWKWTFVSFLVPTSAGILVTFVTTQIVRLFELL